MHVCIDGETKSDIFLLERSFPSVDATEYIVAVETSEIKEKLNKLDTLDGEESSQAVTVLIQNFYDILGTYQEKVNYTESKQVDGLVNAFYSKLFGNGGRTSFLFAHRGIGPLDSSLSDKMARGQLNYEDTVSKAELMAVKLGKFNENQRKKYIDVANNILGYEKTVYEFHPSGKNNIVMIDNENNNAPVELLKTPEGVYEAHVIAILLAEAEDNRYITLCLDEPNKCMHPAQVERLRETMLQKVKKGCSIIVSTHSRDMISIDTWKHVHYFKRHTCEGGPRANLAFTRVPFDDPRYQDSFTRGSNPFRDALFARRCLFVEGISDYRFFNVLLEEFQDQNPILKDITIIELTTATKCKLVHNVCQKSQIPHVIWLDGDQRKDYKNQNNSYFWKTTNDLEKTINQYLEPKKRVTKKGER